METFAGYFSFNYLSVEIECNMPYVNFLQNLLTNKIDYPTLELMLLILTKSLIIIICNIFDLIFKISDF